MSNKNENHFVPQFHLRRFSHDGKSIHLLNLKRDIVVPTASIKHECSKRKIHAYDPKIEDALGDLEGIAASITKSICDTHTLPPPQSSDHCGLIAFVVLQRSRTMVAADQYDLMTDALAKICIEGDPKFEEVDLKQIFIANQYPVAMPLKVAAQIIPAALDLHMRLYVNETHMDFVTSDNPVVAHNQFCESVTYIGVLGWRSSGLQIFYPLSPRTLLLLYDGQIYRAGSPRGEPVIKVTDISDIEMLNALQILNAGENIYFREMAQVSALQTLARQLAKKRPKKRMKIVRTERVRDDDGESELMHSFEGILPLRFRLTALTLRRRVRAIPIDIRVRMYRGEPIPRSSINKKPDHGTVTYPVRRQS